MDAWTELNQAVIRDRIREREVEAAGERLASIARCAAAVAAAVQLIIDSRRPTYIQPAQLEPVPSPAAEDDRAAIGHAA